MKYLFSKTSQDVFPLQLDRLGQLNHVHWFDKILRNVGCSKDKNGIITKNKFEMNKKNVKLDFSAFLNPSEIIQYSVWPHEYNLLRELYLNIQS